MEKIKKYGTELYDEYKNMILSVKDVLKSHYNYNEAVKQYNMLVNI